MEKIDRVRKILSDNKKEIKERIPNEKVLIRKILDKEK